jgi:hypothetical protein
MAVKYGIVAFLACTWKWFYYSPNTFKELKIMERKKLGQPVTEEMRPSVLLYTYIKLYASLYVSSY